jgi:hypothetical protein
MGILLPFGTEAAVLDHLLQTCYPENPLTVLMDTLTVLQALHWKCLDPPPEFNLDSHQHRQILTAIISKLYSSTSTMSLEKVK